MSVGPTMTAAVLEEYGAPLRIRDVARPTLTAGQVLLRIEASGVNPLDTKIHAGKAPHARQPLPAILGIDLAGTVVAVGDGVAGFRPGDEVYGMTGGIGGVPGSLAQYATVDADLLAPKPANLSMREAAALPLVFITAWEGLVDKAAVHAGQHVLVHGGAGGVGHIAIQIARARGAKVSATGSKRSQATIEMLGADFVDRTDPVASYVARHTRVRGFDIVFDNVGGATLDDSFHAVARGGHVVSALGWGTHALAPLSFKAASYSGIFTLLPLLTGEGRAHHGGIMREATRLVEAGAMKPIVDPRHFTLETVLDAYRVLEAGEARTKLVIDVT
jgi:NADPH2:quinone reductase